MNPKQVYVITDKNGIPQFYYYRTADKNGGTFYRTYEVRTKKYDKISDATFNNNLANEVDIATITIPKLKEDYENENLFDERFTKMGGSPVFNNKDSDPVYDPNKTEVKQKTAFLDDPAYVSEREGFPQVYESSFPEFEVTADSNRTPQIITQTPQQNTTSRLAANATTAAQRTVANPPAPTPSPSNTTVRPSITPTPAVTNSTGTPPPKIVPPVANKATPPAPNTGGTPTPNTSPRITAKSDPAILEEQKVLQAAGLYKGALDGIDGSQTKAARKLYETWAIHGNPNSDASKLIDKALGIGAIINRPLPDPNAPNNIYRVNDWQNANPQTPTADPNAAKPANPVTATGEPTTEAPTAGEEPVVAEDSNTGEPVVVNAADVITGPNNTTYTNGRWVTMNSGSNNPYIRSRYRTASPLMVDHIAPRNNQQQAYDQQGNPVHQVVDSGRRIVQGIGDVAGNIRNRMSEGKERRQANREQRRDNKNDVIAYAVAKVNDPQGFDARQHLNTPRMARQYEREVNKAQRAKNRGVDMNEYYERKTGTWQGNKAQPTNRVEKINQRVNDRFNRVNNQNTGSGRALSANQNTERENALNDARVQSEIAAYNQNRPAAITPEVRDLITQQQRARNAEELQKVQGNLNSAQIIDPATKGERRMSPEEIDALQRNNNSINAKDVIYVEDPSIEPIQNTQTRPVEGRKAIPVIVKENSTSSAYGSNPDEQLLPYDPNKDASEEELLPYTPNPNSGEEELLPYKPKRHGGLIKAQEGIKTPPRFELNKTYTPAQISNPYTNRLSIVGNPLGTGNQLGNVKLELDSDNAIKNSSNRVGTTNQGIYNPNAESLNYRSIYTDPLGRTAKANFPEPTADTKTVPAGDVLPQSDWTNRKLNVYGNILQHRANMVPLVYQSAKALFDKPERQNSIYNKQDQAYLQGMRRNLIAPNMNPIVDNRALMNQMVRSNARGSGQLLSTLQGSMTAANKAMNDEQYRTKSANQAQMNNYYAALNQVGDSRRQIDQLTDDQNRKHRLQSEIFTKDALEAGEKALMNKGIMHNQELKDKTSVENYLNQLSSSYSTVYDPAKGHYVVVFKKPDGTMGEMSLGQYSGVLPGGQERAAQAAKKGKPAGGATVIDSKGNPQFEGQKFGGYTGNKTKYKRRAF